MPEFQVYVVELSADVCNRTNCPSAETGKPHVYVGETKQTPEARFAEHLAGGFTSARSVRRCGVRLLPDLYRARIRRRTRAASRAAEVKLADQLRRRGHCVFGGH